jgi:triple functional domain protein
MKIREYSLPYLRRLGKEIFCSLQAPGVEMTWVIADHVAAAGSQELSVHKGQQVEVLELNTSAPDWCLVRMPTSGSSVDSPPEGLVPLAVLKQPPPGLKTSPSRRPAADHESGEYLFLSSEAR